MQSVLLMSLIEGGRESRMHGSPGAFHLHGNLSHLGNYSQKHYRAAPLLLHLCLAFHARHSPQTHPFCYNVNLGYMVIVLAEMMKYPQRNIYDNASAKIQALVAQAT